MQNQIFAFFIITFIAALGMSGLYVYAWKQRPAGGAATFAMLLFSLTVWTGAILMGMLSRTEAACYAWAVVRMAGVFAAPVFWLLFAHQYSGKKSRLNTKRAMLLGIIPFLSLILMVSNGSHHLFLEGIVYERHGLFLIDADWIPGSWFPVHVAYSYALVLGGVFFFMREARRLMKAMRGQAVSLMVGATVPLVVNILYVFNLIPGLIINYDPLGFVISGCVFAWSFSRYRLFDILPVARRALVDSLSDGLVVVDLKNRIVDINPEARRIFNEDIKGLDGKSIVRKNLASVLPQLADRFGCNETENNDDSFEYDNDLYDLRISPLRVGKKSAGYLLLLRDVTTQKRMERQLRNLAQNDPLTGVYNRRRFFELAEAEIVRARRYVRNFSILLIDCDHFKPVNDQYGHQAGDRVLQALTQVCRRHIRETDILARYGGEEFIIAAPESSVEEAANLAERLRESVEDMKVDVGEKVIRITISIGVANLNDSKEGGEQLQSVIDRADAAMYRAKRAGRNRIVFSRQ